MLALKRISAIEKLRGDRAIDLNSIPLKEGETSLLHNQGVLKLFRNSGWLPGRAFLTSERLVFKQVTKIKLEVSLDNILRCTQGYGLFVGRKKKTLQIELSRAGGQKSLFWLLVEPVEPWLKAITEREEKGSKRFLEVLDEGSFISVLMEVPFPGGQEVAVDLHERTLRILRPGTEEPYLGEVALPAEVMIDTLTHHYRNNILEIRLNKKEDCIHE